MVQRKQTEEGHQNLCWTGTGASLVVTVQAKNFRVTDGLYRDRPAVSPGDNKCILSN